MIFRFRWMRRAMGGKWGVVSGWIVGQRWVRLPKEALQWDEYWTTVDPQAGHCELCGRKENAATLYGGHHPDCDNAIPF